MTMTEQELAAIEAMAKGGHLPSKKQVLKLVEAVRDVQADLEWHQSACRYFQGQINDDNRELIRLKQENERLLEIVTAKKLLESGIVGMWCEGAGPTGLHDAPKPSAGKGGGA